MNKYAHMLLRPMGKYRFFNKFCPEGTVLDIGSGKSPNRTKKLFPNCQYTGLDITSHYEDGKCLADHYVITTIEDFTNTLSKYDEKFDCTISSHNLEHCDQRKLVLELSAATVKPNGYMYLSFPSEISINFPRGRAGTLNYFDDSTHKELPPTVQWTLQTLESKGFSVVCVKESYKPLILWFIGFLLQPLSILLNKNLVGTMQFYGFETVFWLKRDRL